MGSPDLTDYVLLAIPSRHTLTIRRSLYVALCALIFLSRLNLGGMTTEIGSFQAPMSYREQLVLKYSSAKATKYI